MYKALATAQQRLGLLAIKINQFAATSRARLFVFALFTIQAVVLAFVMHPGVAPDETNHIRFIEYYAHHSLSPDFHNQTPTYYLGDKTREPDFMYHYLMSFVYRLTPLPVHYKYIVIRLLTLALAILSLYVLTKILKRLGFSEATATFTLLILTNLSMVLMMSSAVNNDVTVWLGVALGTLLLLRLKERASLVDLLGLALVIVWGGMFKRDLLPMSLLFGILGLIVFLKYLRTYIKAFKRPQPLAYLLTGFLIVGSFLFVQRILGNEFGYGTVTPSCEQVQGDDACSVFWNSIRAKQLATQPAQHVSPPMFVAKWIGEDTYNIINVQTQLWNRQVKPAWWLTPILTVAFLAGLAYGVYYEIRQRTRTDKLSNLRLYVLFIALFYAGVQLAVNYATFLHNRIFGLALNGRYVIPSLMFLVGFSSYYYSKAFGRKRLPLVALALAVIILLVFNSGLQLLLRNGQLYHAINSLS